MISHIRRWSLPAAFAAAALTLTACGGSNGSPVPLAPNQIPSAGYYHLETQLHAATVSGAIPDAACPKQFLNCYTVSIQSGLVVYWCDGPASNPCGTTKRHKWSGGVCLAKAKTCNPIKQFTVSWTGPFKCNASISICNGGTKGYYELDTVTVGKTPPKQTNKYIYKQAIELNSKPRAYIGLNVGA